MKGYVFYQDKKVSVNPQGFGGVIAVNNPREYQGSTLNMDCYASLQDIPDSLICSTSASIGYLRESCKKISEFKARRLHPTMFQSLDSPDSVDYFTMHQLRMRVYSQLIWHWGLLSESIYSNESELRMSDFTEKEYWESDYNSNKFKRRFKKLSWCISLVLREYRRNVKSKSVLCIQLPNAVINLDGIEPIESAKEMADYIKGILDLKFEDIYVMKDV